MDFFGILLLSFLGILTLVYLCKYLFGKTEYIVEEEITPEDLEMLQHHINNINSVAVNYNPGTNVNVNQRIIENNLSSEEVPPKYEDINLPPNYQQSNSS